MENSTLNVDLVKHFHFHSALRGLSQGEGGVEDHSISKGPINNNVLQCSDGRGGVSRFCDNALRTFEGRGESGKCYITP